MRWEDRSRDEELSDLEAAKGQHDGTPNTAAPGARRGLHRDAGIYASRSLNHGRARMTTDVDPKRRKDDGEEKSGRRG